MLNRKDDGLDPVRGCFNALMITIIGLLAFLVLLNVWRWLMSEGPEPEVRVELEAPVEEIAECLIMLPPEVSEEPDYRLGRGKECEGE